MISEATSFFVFYTTSVVLVSDSLYRCTVRGIQLVKDEIVKAIQKFISVNVGNSYQDDDHGYEQQSCHSNLHNRPIKDDEILVKDGLWKYHYGHSSDNGSSSDDEIYYLYPLFKEKYALISKAIKLFQAV